MILTEAHRIYFLGIGGIGMSALARYFLWLGKDVSGYDRTVTPLTRELEAEGVKINYVDDIGNIPSQTDLVIYTPAIPANSKQLLYFQSAGLPMYKRAHVLGMISNDYKVIAIAGTHGKTTVTTILTHIFKTANARFMAFLGGISTNYSTNFVITEKPEWVIVEADEYDRSFLQLCPDIAIITSMDADHLDIYGSLGHLEESFTLFVRNLKSTGTLITHNSIDKLQGVNERQLYYGLNGQADFSAEELNVTDGIFTCNFDYQDYSFPIVFGWAGRHNIENALAASAAAICAGLNWPDIQSALSTFKGVKRRFEIHIKRLDMVYIDDYAHHPEEIRTCLESAIEMFPGKKITGIFQPHLFTRTRDFAEEFGKALDLLHRVVVMDIYPARELPIQGINAFSILDHINKAEKLHVNDQEILDFIARDDFDVLITMGAGDIDKLVTPIKEKLLR
jgi:UDP-N-acetylmuramate--alanine ligase